VKPQNAPAASDMIKQLAADNPQHKKIFKVKQNGS
jgi:hypothetical protein